MNGLKEVFEYNFRGGSRWSCIAYLRIEGEK
jgi:hypothetical protein